jgi:hypothetical protein
MVLILFILSLDIKVSKDSDLKKNNDSDINLNKRNNNY